MLHGFSLFSDFMQRAVATSSIPESWRAWSVNQPYHPKALQEDKQSVSMTTRIDHNHLGIENTGAVSWPVVNKFQYQRMTIRSHKRATVSKIYCLAIYQNSIYAIRVIPNYTSETWNQADKWCNQSAMRNWQAENLGPIKYTHFTVLLTEKSKILYFVGELLK